MGTEFSLLLPWETKPRPALAAENPDWWPYGADFPSWHVWKGVAGLLYARRPRSSPPRIVRGKDLAALRDRIAEAEAPPRPQCRRAL